MNSPNQRTEISKRISYSRNSVFENPKRKSRKTKREKAKQSVLHEKVETNDGEDEKSDSFREIIKNHQMLSISFEMKMPVLKEKHPDFDYRQLIKLISDKYKDLPDKEYDAYREKAKRLKAVYEERFKDESDGGGAEMKRKSSPSPALKRNTKGTKISKKYKK